VFKIKGEKRMARTSTKKEKTIFQIRREENGLSREKAANCWGQ